MASAVELPVVARLLDDFNREFDTPTPGPDELARRLPSLLATGDLVVLLAGEPAVGVAVVSLRPNVWCEGPVGLLDELYVAPPQRNLGIGTALLRAAESLVRERGGTLLEIEVDAPDTDARRFYERHGYRCGSDGDAALSYHRPLDT